MIVRHIDKIISRTSEQLGIDEHTVKTVVKYYF